MTTAIKMETMNTAMAHLGETPFLSITTEPQPPKLAKVLAQLDGRAGVERWALSRHPWLCALAYATLSPSGTIEGNHKWDYVFELPATFVKLWECSADRYVVGTAVKDGAQVAVIYANEAELDVSYTETKDYEAYTPDLCGVIAYMLAARTAGPLQENYKKSQALKAEATAALNQAMSGEADQHHGEAEDDDPKLAGGFAALRATAG